MSEPIPEGATKTVNQKLVTYLLGAGASAHALPTVADIPGSLVRFHAELRPFEAQLSNTDFFGEGPLKAKTKQAYFQEMLQAILWLANEAGKHASVDTLAKKLYLTGTTSQLRQLKIVLTLYFLWKQLPDLPDPRYDTFIASISNLNKNSLRVADNLRIISWNYDFQFEKAFAPYLWGEYTKLKDFSSIQERLNIVPRKIDTFDFHDEFGVLKLNGTAAFVNDSKAGLRPLIDDVNFERSLLFAERLAMTYAGLMTSSETVLLLNFAWESSGIQAKILDIAKGIAYKTEVLVVIGYSFPFFNREVDRSIIRTTPELRAVYFQAKGKDVYKNIERFRSIRSDLAKDQLIPVEDVDQFFLPPEL